MPIRPVLIGLALLLAAGCATQGPANDGVAVIHTATFVAADGRSVRAVYRDNDRVTLTLPGGAEVVLPIAISGSGARYADGNRQWWEHQGEATYSVDDRVVFRGRLQ